MCKNKRTKGLPTDGPFGTNSKRSQCSTCVDTQIRIISNINTHADMRITLIETVQIFDTLQTLFRLRIPFGFDSPKVRNGWQDLETKESLKVSKIWTVSIRVIISIQQKGRQLQTSDMIYVPRYIQSSSAFVCDGVSAYSLSMIHSAAPSTQITSSSPFGGIASQSRCSRLLSKKKAQKSRVPFKRRGSASATASRRCRSRALGTRLCAFVLRACQRRTP